MEFEQLNDNDFSIIKSRLSSLVCPVHNKYLSFTTGGKLSFNSCCDEFTAFCENEIVIVVADIIAKRILDDIL